MLYLINRSCRFDGNSIRREVYFCLIEEKSLYVARTPTTNTNLKKLLGNTTKRKIRNILWNHIRYGSIDDGLTCIEIVWGDSLLKTKSIEEVLVDCIYSNFIFSYCFSRELWGVRRLD